MQGATYQRFYEATIDRTANGHIDGNPAIDEALEALVDRFDMRIILECLAVIAGEKAEHLRSNWQDEGAARCWEKVGRAIDKAATRAFDVS